VAGAESSGETGGGDGVETISRAHAGLAATIAFVFGALVTWMAPEMIRDAKAWHREFYPGPTRKPADEPGQQQPVR